MQVVRFYGIEGEDIHVLAKFVAAEDAPVERLRHYAQVLVSGIREAKDIVDFLNAKFFEISETMQDDGFTPVDVISAEDHDAKCARTYDYAIDRDARVVELLTFDIHPSDRAPFYAKHLVDRRSFGMLA